MTDAIGRVDAWHRSRATLGGGVRATEPAPLQQKPIGRRFGAGPSLLSADEAAAVGRAYRELFPLPSSLEPHLRGVLEDALGSPGSLVRAQLAFAMALDGAVARDSALRLAVAVEYFHTASLLLDDLPCMDDAADRRGRPCAHLVWGEAAAVLGALALIARGYELLWQSISTLSRSRRDRAAALVAACVGAHGVLDGQARDLHFAAGQPTEQRVREVARGKTVSMIRLTLLLPALASGTNLASIEDLDHLAVSWGLAYQALDDFQDVLLTSEESGKSVARDATLVRPNLVLVCGERVAIVRLIELLDDAGAALAGAPSLHRKFPQLAAIQVFLEREAGAVRARLGGRTAVA